MLFRLSSVRALPTWRFAARTSRRVQSTRSLHVSLAAGSLAVTAVLVRSTNPSCEWAPVLEVLPQDAVNSKITLRVHENVEKLASPVLTTSVFRIVRVALRGITLLALFTPVALALPVWLFMKFVSAKGLITQGNVANEDWFLKLATITCSKAGPVFIKLCQWISMREDIFPRDVCAAFARLQSSAPSHSFSATVAQIENMLNDPACGFVSLSEKDLNRRLHVYDVFERLDAEPVGVGAVAQVHRGKLRSEFAAAVANDREQSGDVAIKVLHPGVAEAMERDLVLLQAAGWAAARIIPGAEFLAVEEEISTFAQMMHSQMDLTVEFHNLLRFRRNFENSSTKHSAIETTLPLSFPEPLFTPNRNVLIERFCPGILFSKIAETGGTVFDDELVRIGLPAFIRMIAAHNFVHADLHGGNVLLTLTRSSKDGHQLFAPENTLESISRADPQARAALLASLKQQGYRPHLVFLDVGLTSSLTPRSLDNMREVFSAFVENDPRRAVQALVSRCRAPGRVVDVVLAEQTLAHLTAHVHGDGGGSGRLMLSELRSAEVMRGAARFFRRHRIGLDGDWAGLFVAAVLVEGVARRMGGDVDVLDILVEEMASTSPLLLGLKGRVSHLHSRVVLAWAHDMNWTGFRVLAALDSALTSLPLQSEFGELTNNMELGVDIAITNYPSLELSVIRVGPFPISSSRIHIASALAYLFRSENVKNVLVVAALNIAVRSDGVLPTTVLHAARGATPLPIPADVANAVMPLPQSEPLNDLFLSALALLMRMHASEMTTQVVAVSAKRERSLETGELMRGLAGRVSECDAGILPLAEVTARIIGLDAAAVARVAGNVKSAVVCGPKAFTASAMEGMGATEDGRGDLMYL
ncbi:hypothetical protein HDU84_007298 [Entophlyctis sp. JEL0112]|nr:hypothetical protein HDU84_007298 [Entophlyctis sp. JEL0112]